MLSHMTAVITRATKGGGAAERAMEAVTSIGLYLGHPRKVGVYRSYCLEREHSLLRHYEGRWCLLQVKLTEVSALEMLDVMRLRDWILKVKTHRRGTAVDTERLRWQQGVLEVAV